MTSEVEMLRHLNDVVLFLLVLMSEPTSAYNYMGRRRAHPFPEIVQDLDLNKGLMMEPLLVADYLDGDAQTGRMIPAVKHLSEGALAQCPDNLVSVGEMITSYDQVIASFVIVAVVIRLIVPGGRLLVAACTDEVHLWIVEDLLPLEV